MRPNFDAVPDSNQNPLLPLKKFAEFCADRFRGASHWSLGERLRTAADANLLRPLCVHEDYLLYSPFQVWQVLHARWGEPSEAWRRVHSFEPVLRLLATVQDYYLPETRGNGRFAEWRDYGGAVVLDGTWFLKTMTYVVSTIRRFRQGALQKGELNPKEALESCAVTSQDLEKWQRHIYMDASSVDPLREWRDLVSSVSYSRRTKLRYEALLATELYAMADILRLLAVDAGLARPLPESLDPTDLAPRDNDTKIPEWRLRKYGDTLWRPHDRLEFISNEYDINPKPRGIILAEGEETEALAFLFRSEGFDPELLGIEFRSISGAGNFQLGNWQPFIEYMHEKQVLIYFVLDREGEVERQATRLLERKRVFECEGLEKVVPAADRIVVWSTSFEEANFTDAEIASALTQAGLSSSAEEVSQERCTARSIGLIEKILRSKTGNVCKPLLDLILVQNLVEWRDENPGAPRRPIEQFVSNAGTMITVNHQPTSVESVKRNRAIRLLG
jgi:hypothetical protein